MTLKAFSVKRIGEILVVVIGCTTHQADSRSEKQPAQTAAIQARKWREPVMIGGNDSICEAPSGPLPSAAVLGHWFANDTREHKRTFGFIPPDSSSVVLLSDSAVSRRADNALDAQFVKWASASNSSTAKSSKSASTDTAVNVLVYKARHLYAVVDVGQKFCGGDEPPLPLVFFFDSRWRYLGSRSI